jgi:hypothetical protein
MKRIHYQIDFEIQRKSVFLSFLTMSPADDLNDIESLQVYSTGDRDAFSTATRFDDQQRVDDNVIF